MTSLARLLAAWEAAIDRRIARALRYATRRT